MEATRGEAGKEKFHTGLKKSRMKSSDQSVGSFFVVCFPRVHVLQSKRVLLFKSPSHTSYFLIFCFFFLFIIIVLFFCLQ